MADRRNQERGQWENPTEELSGAGLGAPGTTGAFQTNDPLGAPGSTGASLTSQHPTRARAVGSDYEDPDMEYGGGQQRQLRRPTSGDRQQHQLHDPTSGDYGGRQQHQLRDPISGDYGGVQQHQLRDPITGEYYGGGQHQQELRDPISGEYAGGQQQQFRDPTSGVYGGGYQQQQVRDPTSGVIGSVDEFERDRAGHGPVGVAGFTRVTRATGPGDDVVYGRETVTTVAEDMGSAAGAGRDEKKGVVEKAKDLKDRVLGGTHHDR